MCSVKTGQKCVPHSRHAECVAESNEDIERASFPVALFGHVGYTLGNAARSLVTALTLARFSAAPDTGATRRYYQHVNSFSARFAFAMTGTTSKMLPKKTKKKIVAR